MEHAAGDAPPNAKWDPLLLFTLGPLALACLALHVHAVASGALLFHAYYVAPGASPADAPVVAGFLTEIEHRGELRVGDRIQRIGDASALGAGQLEVSRLTLAEAHDGVVTLGIERAGASQQARVELVTLQVPWARVPLLLGFFAVGVIVLLRSPGSRDARLMFVAFMNLVVFQSVFTGATPTLFYAGVFLFHVWGVIALSSLGIWVLRFPPDLDSSHRLHWGIAIAGGLLWSLPRITQFLGGPLPLGSLSAQFFAVDAALALGLLAVLRRNYANANPVGRRQVKCVLLGGYLGMLPFALFGALAATAPELPGLRWLHAGAMICVAIGPVGVLVAIARFNLFDIDRLISGTASYTLVLILAAIAGELLVEPVAGLLGGSLGFDPGSSQLVFVAVMTGAVLPIQRAWRPYVDRMFFSAGRSHTEEVEHLLEELPAAAAGGSDALLNLAGERIDTVFSPRFCVLYRRRGEAFDPAFVAGDRPPGPLSDEGSRVIARILGKRIGPLRLDSRGRAHEDPAPGEEVEAALEGLDAALLVPLRPHGALGALLCLGPKRSGDVYTATDVTLIASVAHHLSEELSTLG